MEPGCDLKKCAQCKLAYYCSREHQRADWKDHKDICKAVLTTAQRLRKPLLSPDQTSATRVITSHCWEDQLGRSLKPYEDFMWQFPRVCRVCQSSENLIDCEKCWCAAYCSEDHKEEDLIIHELFCSELRICFELDKLFSRSNYFPTFKVPLYPSNIVELSEAYKSIYAENVPEPYSTYIDILKSMSFSCILTIIHALELATVIKKRKTNKKNLVVHIVGASSFEGAINWSLCAELILHWITNLKKIHFALVGPEIEGDLGPVTTTAGLCESCTKGGKQLVIEFHQKYYHEVSVIIFNPDIVVAFNCGLHEVTYKGDFWKDSLKDLMYYKDVPLCLTSYYNSEMAQDLEKLESAFTGAKLEYIIKNQKNPYSCKKPYRDWLNSSEECSVFYNNDIISILRRKY